MVDEGFFVDFSYLVKKPTWDIYIYCIYVCICYIYHLLYLYHMHLYVSHEKSDPDFFLEILSFFGKGTVASARMGDLSCD